MTGVIPTPTAGETWRRRNGRERVYIGRVWAICGCNSPVMHGVQPEHGAEPVLAVRCHPRHGGPWWWTVLPEFLERFTRDESYE
jgi:hypothetical protein